MAKLKAARRKSGKLGLGDSKTVLFCMDRKCGKCASGKQMKASWQHLKHSLKKLARESDQRFVRLKADCVGVCTGGPILAVFPDGVWYGGCTPQVIDDIVQNHLANGNVLKEHVIAEPTFNK